MTVPTPPYGLPPVVNRPRKRRLKSWQIVVLAAVAGVLFLGVLGTIVSAVNTPTTPVAAPHSEGTTNELAGAAGTAPAAASIDDNETPGDSPTLSPPPTTASALAPSPAATTKAPTRNSARTPARAHTTTTKAAPAPRHTHSGRVRPGAYCPSAEHYWYGLSAKGKLYQCLDNNGWRWEPV